MRRSSFFLRQSVPVAFLLPILFTVSLFFSFPLSADDDLEELFDQSDESGRIEQLLQELQQLRQQKIPVNTATPEELLRIPFFSPGDVRSIVDYRERKGPFTSVEELAALVGDETAQRVALFLSFETGKPQKSRGKEKIRAKWYNRYFSEIPERKGIQTGKYQGDNYKLYNRLSVMYNGIAFSGVREKDVGEPDVDDFLSLSLAYSGEGFVRQFILGNYTVNTGQGLLFGQSRYFSKGVEPLGVMLSGRRLKPYASSVENGFMQGVAAAIETGAWELTAFYSDNLVDATVHDGLARTIRTSGYHRTESEIEHKDNVAERVAGLNLRYTLHSGIIGGSFGGTWARYKYSVPHEDAGGKAGWIDMGGVEADFRIGAVSLFGEAALAGSEPSLSWIGGARVPVARTVRTVLAVRDYHTDYFSPFAGAFAERADDASNEQGCYVGVEAALRKNLHVGAFYDLFRFPELSSRYQQPSTGSESKLFLSWRGSPSFKTALLLQHQYKERAKKVDGENGESYYTAVPFISNRIRLDLFGRISGMLSLKTRGDLKVVVGDYPDEKERSQGWLFYEQATIKKGDFSLKARYTLFNTDNYDSAMYVYEDDLPLVFTLKSYYGEGQAFFALVSLDLFDHFKVAARYAKTWYSDREVYSSGHDERETNAPATYHLGCALRF